jgi:hypothetical protein
MTIVVWDHSMVPSASGELVGTVYVDTPISRMGASTIVIAPLGIRNSQGRWPVTRSRIAGPAPEHYSIRIAE